jgi:Sulfotransferase family
MSGTGLSERVSGSESNICSDRAIVWAVMTGVVEGSATTHRIETYMQQSSDRVGLYDFGPNSWREGLAVLVETLENAPHVEPAGREDFQSQVIDALSNRLRVVDFHKRHPQLAETPIERPLVVLGLPRTGTTVVSYLLDQDPARRSLLNWEAGDSVPPPTTQTLRSDPRCLAKKVQLDELAVALQEAQFPVPHWEDADGPTECSFILNQDFKALIWDMIMPITAYGDWFLDADLTSAYEYERLTLQVLQSKAPGTWSLKMPSHAVHIDALLNVFPDARIVWAHRDPFKVTVSYLNMNELARTRILGPSLDVTAFVPSVLRQLRAHVERPLRTRARIGDERFYDLHYDRLLREPIAEMRALYRWAGDPLTPAVESRMAGWLRGNPQHKFGRPTYQLERFGICRADIEPIFDEYISALSIELEA